MKFVFQVLDSYVVLKMAAGNLACILHPPSLDVAFSAIPITEAFILKRQQSAKALSHTQDTLCQYGTHQM